MESTSQEQRAGAGGIRAAPGYVRRGLGLAWQHGPFYVLVTLLCAAPALVAAGLALRRDDWTLLELALAVVLPWVTALLGTTTVMVSMAWHFKGRTITIPQALWLGVTWLPRYTWTNAHTTVVFWIPVAGLGFLGQWLPAGVVVPLLAVAAVSLHARTMLAPFYAVHDNLGGTRAAWVAWVVAGRHFPLAVAVLLLGIAPTLAILVPLVLLLVALTGVTLPSVVSLAGGELLAAGIQAVRPVLIASLYAWFRDLETSDPPAQIRLPGVLAPLAALTRPLPHWGRGVPPPVPA